jgi:hypothetical protein
MAGDSKTRWLSAAGALGSLLAGLAAVAGVFVMRDRENAPPPSEPPAKVEPTTAPADVEVEAPRPQPPAPRDLDTSPPPQFPIHGHWQGAIYQPNAGTRAQYEVIVSIFIAPGNRIAGEVEYPDFNCGGIWLGDPDSATAGGPWRVRESIRRNPEACVPVYLDLARRSDNAIDVAIRATPSGDTMAAGTIYRAN